MTLEELLARSRRLIVANFNAHVDPEALATAHTIIDLLGVSRPRGYEAPETGRFSDGRAYVAFGEDVMEVDEARGFAVAILRAADEAEAK